jgi:cytoskeletal protein RodZ
MTNENMHTESTKQVHSLGQRLRAAREARQLSCQDIAVQLRLKEHVIHLLEEDSYTA